MRLICPNCGAQYDIANDAIPEGGRDVQCSSCAHTWFQTEKPIVAGRARSELLLDTPSVEAPEPPVAEKPRRPLDSAITDILREEVAHEQSARQSDDDAPPATQADAAAPAVDADETRRRIAQMTIDEGGTRASVAAAATGAVSNAAAAAAADANLRAVPSIDEINASLRARAEASDTSGLTEAEKQEALRRRGFRRGFFFVLILLALAITPYFFQEQINANLPQFSNYMTSYIETIDGLRLRLNDLVQTVQGLIGGAETAAPTDGG